MKNFNQTKLSPNSPTWRLNKYDVWFFNGAETQDLWKKDCAKSSHILYETANLYKIKR